MISRETCRYDTRRQALQRAMAISMLLAVCDVGGWPEITTAHADENSKAIGEDLLIAELSALAAELKYEQLAKRGKTSIPELKEKYLRYVELVDDGERAKMRGICAADRMPVVKRKVDAAEPAPVLPEVHAYCLKAIEVSAQRDRLPDLYINLALQEQGQSEFRSAEQAGLLKNDEAGRTTGLILRAANAGQATFESVTGKIQQLPCPLALDAGFTWAYRNPDKKQAYEVTASEVETMARACYDPSIKEIPFRGDTLAVSRAGLLAGAALGRQKRLASVR